MKKEYAGYSIEEVTEQAKSVKAKYGYAESAVIRKTFYSGDNYLIGFHFGVGEHVGDKGVFPSGDKYEVIAIV